MKRRFLTPAYIVLVAAFMTAPFIALTKAVPTTTTVQQKTQIGNPDAGISVVWLVLDEAPLYALLKTNGEINAERFPGFAKLASLSTWYRNTLGTAQRTTEAVPAMLDGMWPTMRNYPYLVDHPVNLFTLANGHKALDVYQSITNLCPEKVCPNKIPDEERQAEFQVKAFRNLIKESSSSISATVHFSHILLPHRPWRFTTDGRLGRELATDPRPSTQLDRRRDAYQSLLRQFVATDAMLLDFLNQLEQSANWDRTMLVVTSDHGMTFVPCESFRDEINPNNPPTLDDIYRVPLFIKYPNQSTPSVSDCPISSIDILPTVLSVAEIPHSATFDGVDLSSACPQRTSRRVQWPYTGRDMTTDFTDLVKRVQYYDTWVDANGSVDDLHRVGRSGVLLGMSVTTSKQATTSVTWTNVDPESFTDIGDTPLSYAPGRVSGRVTTTAPICSQCEGIIVADGIVVASIPELAGLQPSKKPAYFTTSVMTSQISSKSSTPELWIADWTSTAPKLSKVGPSAR